MKPLRNHTRFLFWFGSQAALCHSRPLERRGIMRIMTLFQPIVFSGGRDEDILTSLAARLARFNRKTEPAQREEIATASAGHISSTLATALLPAIDRHIERTF
jgi:type I restriction enzyme R subunit